MLYFITEQAFQLFFKGFRSFLAEMDTDFIGHLPDLLDNGGDIIFLFFVQYSSLLSFGHKNSGHLFISEWITAIVLNPCLASSYEVVKPVLVFLLR